ncbi:MAG: ArsC family transcriptional regulator [Clostridia bacterium]|nr:ArsC family transcriptional regulator [Clostridia bacterium]
MNIQIYGRSKCFDTRKAERYFKERKIRFQSIDLPRFGMSAGEYRNIAQAVGGMEKLMDPASVDDTAILIRHLADRTSAEEKLLANPRLFRTPIVRNGREATVGYCPDIWKDWK